ncbi:MAG TPA: tetratricopeptide repeat protein [Caldimonas sp.]|nr:tetratricopeptide repeat protein [Caldimonas sp.]
MMMDDLRGCTASGATPAALAAYERAVAAWQAWRRDDGGALATARRDAPGFVMAHMLAAWQLATGRDVHRVDAARPIVAAALRLPANERERMHLAALSAVLADDFEGAKAKLGRLLSRFPRDVVALQVAQSLDYVTGDVARMRRHVARALPAWSHDDPGYHALLAMHAFALAESGEHARAEDAARAALALNPLDARACHAMAHVFEMTDRPAEGVRWMAEHAGVWASDSAVVTHGWWHVALFHLSAREPDRALDVYDTHVRAARSADVSDLIDASALLWRIGLAGRNAGARWSDLADAWSRHIDDAFCSFSDVHAMLAFVGAKDRDRARRLEAELAHRQWLRTRYGRTTRQLGLPACRALIAFGSGDDDAAIKLLARLPSIAHRLGGSHAQRDVLHLTLQHAVERARRSPPRLRPSFATFVAPA